MNYAVNMNDYNLPIEQIKQEWTANLVVKTAQSDEGVTMGCTSQRENFVDTVQVSFPRIPGSGLGIALEEIAGGREDRLGITLVSGLVEGGAAEGKNILEGDAIVKVSVLRRNRLQGSGLTDTEEEIEVKTECLDYDATVEALQSLPPQKREDELYIVTLKRLRRKPKVTVNLQYPPEQEEEDVTLEIFSGEILRQAMLVRGVKLNDPLAKRFDTKNGGNCGGNSMCRTCAVSILQGGDLLNPQKPAEQQMLATTPRWRLACKSVVGFGFKEGSMTIRVSPSQWDAQ